MVDLMRHRGPRVVIVLFLDSLQQVVRGGKDSIVLRHHKVVLAAAVLGALGFLVAPEFRVKETMEETVSHPHHTAVAVAAAQGGRVEMLREPEEVETVESVKS
jgi:hypothetical protein